MSALNKYTANDCFLSFLILAAEYKYIWSNTVYLKARSSYAELQDKLASGVVGSLLMFERARCIESVLLTHKDRLMVLKRAHVQTDYDRDSSPPATPHGLPAARRMSPQEHWKMPLICHSICDLIFAIWNWLQ